MRIIFAQPNRQAAGRQLAETVNALQPRWPKAAEVLAAAEDDVLAYMAFPMEHWTRIYSTNPLCSCIAFTPHLSTHVGTCLSARSRVR